ncbi:hypothetical protein RhiirB3_488722 [Rhizophagus irregularis]|nr:hypothetical protein RhiirB3_488722 [Rhizophagus irregularis]
MDVNAGTTGGVTLMLSWGTGFRLEDFGFLDYLGYWILAFRVLWDIGWSLVSGEALQIEHRINLIIESTGVPDPDPDLLTIDTEDKHFLCKCTFCLNEDANGVILNQNTYNRHRSRIQEYSVRDEYLEDLNQQIEKDMSQYTEEENKSLYTEEDINLHAENIHLQTEEDIHLQTEDYIDGESYDTESVNFNDE